MRLFDICVNLTNDRLLRDLDGVVVRAKQAGVDTLLITGTSASESQAAAQLCEQYSHTLLSTAGIHPHYAKDASDDDLVILRELCALPQVRAVGECGLDFNRNFSPADIQQRIFEAQLDLAADVQLPVFLHERDAFDTQYALIKRYRDRLSGGVAHCFTGTQEQMQAYLDADLYIGITGWLCDPKRGADLRAAVKHLPLSRLLIETDAPYLTPKTLRPQPKVNEPAYLGEVIRVLAEVKGVSEEDIAAASWDNSVALFGAPTWR